MPVEASFDEQASLTFENLQRTLQKGGSCLDEIIKVTIYVTNMTLFRPKIMDLRQNGLSHLILQILWWK